MGSSAQGSLSMAWQPVPDPRYHGNAHSWSLGRQAVCPAGGGRGVVEDPAVAGAEVWHDRFFPKHRAVLGWLI